MKSFINITYEIDEITAVIKKTSFVIRFKVTFEKSSISLGIMNYLETFEEITYELSPTSYVINFC